ncbi:MAG: lipoyl(octanoyl) transferase LipB [Chloroflexi bacterium]|nr:MAG: lipoyl(octanoyl) transferase LipB [Chloroflexota bacterium]
MRALSPMRAAPAMPPLRVVPPLPLLEALWLGTVSYRSAWELQRSLATARCRGELADDCVVLLEHPPVYTVGRTGLAEHVPGGPDSLRALGAEYVEVDRGGSVTFHGPGQLVAYPVIRLAGAFPVAGAPQHGDVVRYLRALEAALCALAADLGVAAAPRPPYTGAWVGRDKLAAIGVKLSHGVTTHGLALNVTTDLAWFDPIVPCGISDGGVTSLAALGVTGVSPESLASALTGHLAAALGRSVSPAGQALLDLAAALPEPSRVAAPLVNPPQPPGTALATGSPAPAAAVGPAFLAPSTGSSGPSST